ncbi:hypothetical protein ACGFNP_38745 [Nonomuraea sp. NPDC049269]|uniref:hypothetical protein n=1 Tax=Nonomuraea sp. NPDC049269 TaxID=3364349 RepID=UPI00371B72DD
MLAMLVIMDAVGLVSTVWIAATARELPAEDRLADPPPARRRVIRIAVAAVTVLPMVVVFPGASKKGLKLKMDEIGPLLALARETLRAHVKRRDQERRTRLIQEWKIEGVYPYSEEPAEPAQAVEREMFDEVATRISRRLPGVTQSKKTTLRLLREIISRDPSGLYPVLDELFRLPQSEQEELKRILQRTSLSEVIKATGQVSDRSISWPR